jgi:ribosomal protein S6
MRTIILMTGFIVTLCFNLNAQSFVFNKIYHFGPEADHEKAQSIIETEKGFIIAGDVDSYIIPYTGNKLLLYEIDKEGNLIWSRQFYNADYDRFSSGCNLFRVNDSLYDWFVVQS